MIPAAVPTTGAKGHLRFVPAPSPAGGVGSRAVEQETRTAPNWTARELELFGVVVAGGWPGLLRALDAAPEVGHTPPLVPHVVRVEFV